MNLTDEMKKDETRKRLHEKVKGYKEGKRKQKHPEDFTKPLKVIYNHHLS